MRQKGQSIMAKANRTCAMCHTKYEYCNSCPSHKTLPAWMGLFHDENCLNIYGALTSYRDGEVDKDKTAKKLAELDLSKFNDFSKSTQDKITEIMGKAPVKPVVKVKEEVIEEKEKTIESQPKKIGKHPTLKEELTFENFVNGDNSEFAYKAALAVAKEPGKKFNPILLYGGSGLGKTHLMNSIGNYIYNNGGEKLKICYVSAENFGNDFTSSLTSKKTNEFKNKYRNLDVLLLDDIHFFQGKEGMQNELFYTFEALSQKNAQMVFTCDRPIKETKNMADRLVSRLSNGLCIDLQPPNYETRFAILKKKLQLQKLILPITKLSEC